MIDSRRSKLLIGDYVFTSNGFAQYIIIILTICITIIVVNIIIIIIIIITNIFCWRNTGSQSTMNSFQAKKTN